MWNLVEHFTNSSTSAWILSSLVPGFSEAFNFRKWNFKKWLIILFQTFYRKNLNWVNEKMPSAFCTKIFSTGKLAVAAMRTRKPNLTFFILPNMLVFESFLPTSKTYNLYNGFDILFFLLFIQRICQDRQWKWHWSALSPWLWDICSRNSSRCSLWPLK